MHRMYIGCKEPGGRQTRLAWGPKRGPTTTTVLSKKVLCGASILNAILVTIGVLKGMLGV